MKLDLRVLIDLATQMPNLEYLGVQTGGHEWNETLDEEEDPCSAHYEHDWSGPRRDARHDFAAAVTSRIDELPKMLKRASLDFLSPLLRATDIHHAVSLPDLVGTALIHDPFSSSLSLLCNNLRHLQLRTMIDESLFIPTLPQSCTVPHTGIPWPHLELLELMFHNARLDGSWYFSGPAGQGNVARGLPVTHASYPPYAPTQSDEEMDEFYYEEVHGTGGVRHLNNVQFRVTTTAHLDRLLDRFARAAVHMPALKEAMIWSPLRWTIIDTGDFWSKPTNEDDDGDGLGIHNEELAWGIIYIEPGHSGSRRRLDWLLGKWRPEQETRRLFREIGRAKHGDELDELWNEGINGKVVDRDWFLDSVKGLWGDDMGCV